MADTEVVAAPITAPASLGAPPDVSVVVPIYNEEDTVDELYRRVVAALEGAGLPFELIFVDDGSHDRTFERLARARADIVVTMDGDLQNHPEDIPTLVRAVEDGADVASGRRASRHDSWGRTLPSRMINGMLRRFTGVDISDFGCAFNAYRRDAVEPMLGAIGRQKFTKALVLSGGASVVEVDVGHAPRDGASRYSPLRLTRLALHVLAGFWPQPIQTTGILLGTLCSLASLV